MTLARGNALTLDEVGVSEDDAAQVIYDLRRDKARLIAALDEFARWGAPGHQHGTAPAVRRYADLVFRDLGVRG